VATTTSEVGPASVQELAGELARLVESLGDQFGPMQEMVESLKGDGSIEGDSSRRWIVVGFTQEVELYLTMMLCEVLELRTIVNGGTEQRDMDLMDAVGAKH
jgi:hypothetical protein